MERLARVVGAGGAPEDDFIVPITMDRRMRVGSTAAVLAPDFTQLPGGLFVPSRVAQRQEPIDLMQVYLTLQELTDSMTATSDLLYTLKRLSRNVVLAFASSWIARMSAPGADVNALSKAYVELLPANLQARASNLVAGGRRRLLAHQCFLVLSKLAVALCPDEGDGDIDEQELALTPLAVADHLGRSGAASPEATTVSAESITPLVQEIVSNQHFNFPNDPAHLVGRWVRQWRELPVEQPINEVDPLETLYAELTGTNFDDLSAVVLSLWARASDGNVVTSMEYFDPLRLTPEVFQATLDIISAPVGAIQAGIVADWERTGPDGLGWEFSTFGRSPVIRYHDGLLVLDPKLLLQRAFGWPPYFDVESGLAGDARRKNLFSLATRLHAEAYALEVLRSVAPDTAGTKRLYDEQDLRDAFGRPGVKLVDAVIDYGDAWVVLDVTTRRLTRPTVAGVSPDALLDDIKKLVLKKAQQIESTIEQLRADEESLTGQPATTRRRFVPVIVAAEGFPVNPATTAIITDVLTEAGLLRAGDVLPLQVLDLVELEMVEGLAEHGGPTLVDLVANKATAGLSRCAMRDYMLVEARLAPHRPARLESLWKQPFDRVAGRLDDAESSPGEAGGSD